MINKEQAKFKKVLQKLGFLGLVFEKFSPDLGCKFFVKFSLFKPKKSVFFFKFLESMTEYNILVRCNDFIYQQKDTTECIFNYYLLKEKYK